MSPALLSRIAALERKVTSRPLVIAVHIMTPKQAKQNDDQIAAMYPDSWVIVVRAKEIEEA